MCPQLAPEIERKFLLPEIPKLCLAEEVIQITQGYISTRKLLQSGVRLLLKEGRIELSSEGNVSWGAALPKWADALIASKKRPFRLRQETFSNGEVVYTLTLKRKIAGVLHRDEWNCRVPDWVFSHLEPLAKKRSISKVRHLIREGAYLVEVDVFEEPHFPLCIAEVEFVTLEEAQAYPGPSTIGKWEEVTENPEFRHRYLAKLAA